MALRHHLDIQKTGIACCRTDGVIQVQLICGTCTGEFAQATQRYLDVPRAQLNAVIQIFKVAFIPDFYRLFIAAIGSNAHTFRVIALLPKRRGAAGANPLIATFVTLFLLLQAFLEFLYQFLQPAQGLYFRLLFFGEVFHELRAQPVVGDQCLYDIVQRFKILEMQAECPIKAIKVLFVLDHAGPAEIVKLVHTAKSDVLL